MIKEKNYKLANFLTRPYDLYISTTCILLHLFGKGNMGTFHALTDAIFMICQFESAMRKNVFSFSKVFTSVRSI